MTRFLIFYFFAYGGAHLYFFVKLKNAFTLSAKARLTALATITAFFLSPLIARKLESHGFDLLPELVSNGGYLWMGLLFLFVSSAALIDGVNLVLCKTALQFPAKPLFLSAVAYSLIIGSYGYYEAINIVTEHLTIKSPGIPSAVGRVRIVQISDVHVGQIVRESRIRAIISVIREASPDLIVSTGDLVDGHQRHFSGLDHHFLELRPTMGKYAILGNHEYYVGIEESTAFMKGAGFRLLKNETVDLGGIIHITGVDDSRKKPERIKNALVESGLLDSAAAGGFRLLLKHRPIVEKNSEGKFDLQLSGHVHKGQIFPFNLLTWLSFPVRTGLTALAQDSHLYVSRGTGVWGPPIRFMAPPEITVIDLIHEKRGTTKNY